MSHSLTSRLAKWWFPYHGYHWGNRGGVSSAAVEKPHRSSWRPVLECEFDLAYSPLMEMEYGQGKLLLCTLDLEEHYTQDPVAELMAHRIIKYAATSPAVRKSGRTGFLGNAGDAALLDELGVVYEPAELLDASVDLLIVGSDMQPDMDELRHYLQAGGRAFFMVRKTPLAGIDISFEHSGSFHGELAVPDWEEARGLSPSDLRWRTDAEAWLLAGSVDTASGGLFGRLSVGKGTAVFCQVDPRMLDADRNTYFRFTRWRQFRTLAQVLSNMGAAFQMDGHIFKLSGEMQIPLAGEWTSTLPRSLDLGLSEGDPEEMLTRKLLGGREGIKACMGGKITLPVLWEDSGYPWEMLPEEVVFEKTVDIPPEWQGRDLLLSLGKLDNTEDTFFNGVCISRLEPKPPAPHNYPRVYTVPAGLVRSGTNTVTVCIYERKERFDAMRGGGFAGPASEMFLRPKQGRLDDGYYHPDYRYDYVYGDDPYRYFNW